MSIFRTVIDVTSRPGIRDVEEAETSCFFPYYRQTGVGRAAHETDSYSGVLRDAIHRRSQP
jgi:hypothetical protein